MKETAPRPHDDQELSHQNVSRDIDYQADILHSPREEEQTSMQKPSLRKSQRVLDFVECNPLKMSRK